MLSIKRSISFILAFLIFLMSPQFKILSLASENTNLPSNISIIEDSANCYVVKEIKSTNEIIISSNDLVNHILTITKYDSEMNFISEMYIDLAMPVFPDLGTDLGTGSPTIPDVPNATVVSIDKKETVSKRNYEIQVYTSYTLWNLQKWNDYKYFIQSSANQQKLNNYKSAVDDLKNCETSLSLALSSALFSTVVYAGATGGSGAAIAAVAGAAGALPYVVTYGNALDYADACYNAL